MCCNGLKLLIFSGGVWRDVGRVEGVLPRGLRRQPGRQDRHQRGQLVEKKQCRWVKQIAMFLSKLLHSFAVKLDALSQSDPSFHPSRIILLSIKERSHPSPFCPFCSSRSSSRWRRTFCSSSDSITLSSPASSSWRWVRVLSSCPRRPVRLDSHPYFPAFSDVIVLTRATRGQCTYRRWGQICSFKLQLLWYARIYPKFRKFLQRLPMASEVTSEAIFEISDLNYICCHAYLPPNASRSKFKATDPNIIHWLCSRYLAACNNHRLWSYYTLKNNFASM